MPNFTDQIGTNHFFETLPERIVSLVPSQTELLFDMGLEENLVGITKFCVHPYHLKLKKKIVGGTKKVYFEKIKLLKPHIIICNKEENTKEMVEELSKICVVWVTNIIKIEDNFQMIKDFGQIFNKQTEAQKWQDKIQFVLNNFKNFIKGKPKQKVAYFIWKNPYMVVGNNNYINEMLLLNNFENIYAEKGRYPIIELKKIRLGGEPDFVFLSSEPYPFKQEDALEIERFTHHAKTFFVDGEMFSWYGSRMLKAIEYFKILHDNDLVKT